jgi:hypothetical protein
MRAVLDVKGWRTTVDTRIPTYFPGDVMKLRLRFHHAANLVDVWANFEKEVEVATLAYFRFTATLRNHGDLRLLDRAGAQMLSEVVLQASISKETPLPGVYRLSEIRGLPSGEDRSESSVVVFEVPENVRFRIAAVTTITPPKVTHWELGWEPQSEEPEAGV